MIASARNRGQGGVLYGTAYKHLHFHESGFDVIFWSVEMANRCSTNQQADFNGAAIQGAGGFEFSHKRH